MRRQEFDVWIAAIFSIVTLYAHLSSLCQGDHKRSTLWNYSRCMVRLEN